jgi:hypothetical protein
VDKKLVTREMSVAFAVAIALVFVSSVARADSAFEWAYWDVSPSAGADSEPALYADQVVASIDTVEAYNGYDNVTAEQMRIGFNSGELLEASETPVEGPWVGFLKNVAELRQDGDEPKITNNVAVLGITPKVDSGTLDITSDLEVLKMGYDSKDNTDLDSPNLRILSFGAEEGDFLAIYNSSSPDTRRTVLTDAQSLNGENKGQYFSKIEIEKYTTVGTLSGSFSLNGKGFIGKTMPLADIAYQTQIGKSYTFSGGSLDGSPVIIVADFGKAAWSGSWGGAKSYDAFNAGGKITGTTLTSSSVIGVSDKTSGTYVQGGNVTGTLIGVLNATASNAGIIGKTELNVGAVGTTAVKAIDVFAATIVVPTK